MLHPGIQILNLLFINGLLEQQVLISYCSSPPRHKELGKVINFVTTKNLEKTYEESFSQNENSALWTSHGLFRVQSLRIPKATTN